MASNAEPPTSSMIGSPVSVSPVSTISIVSAVSGAVCASPKAALRKTIPVWILWPLKISFLRKLAHHAYRSIKCNSMASQQLPALFARTPFRLWPSLTEPLQSSDGATAPGASRPGHQSWQTKANLRLEGLNQLLTAMGRVIGRSQPRNDEIRSDHPLIH